MSLLDNDITMTAIATELGITLGNDRKKSDLTRHANIKKYSFYRPGSISANATTKLVEFTAFSDNDKTGDFRRYSQSTTAPQTESDYNHGWGPGGTTTTLTFTITTNQLNIKELGLGDYYSFYFYSSAANRASKTSPVKTSIQSITYAANTPPTGHTNNQTQKASSIQIITVTTVTVSHAVLYLDSYISDISGNEKVRFDDSYTDITFVENVVPYMKSTKSIPSGDLPSGNSPAGNPWSATGSRFQIYSAATPKCSAANVNQSTGTSYSFYWTVVLADTLANFYTAGITSLDIKCYNDDGSMSDDQTIETATSNTDPTTQRAESGTLGSGSMAYNEDWEVYYDTSTGITYNGVYSAC